MLLKSIGSNAEFVRRIEVTRNIIRIAIPNHRRNSGLILNYSSGNCFIEFGDYPHRLISDPTYALKLPKLGGNMDIQSDYVGAIWARWADPHALGYLHIHHYYNSKSC
jgi:hypothetical protein